MQKSRVDRDASCLTKDVLRVVDPPNSAKISSSSPTSVVHSSLPGDDPSRE